MQSGLRAATKSPAVAVSLIALTSALFFLPFLGNVSLFDWDEANFAEASREMIERNNYTQVTINFRPFYQKPPLFIWLQVLSMKLLGVNEFAARFVNAVCGMVTLALVFLIGRRLHGALFGLFWALVFFGSFLPHFFFRSGIIDPVFNLFIFSGIACAAATLLTQAKKPRLAWIACAGLCIGLATLAKGPVAFLIIVLVLLASWAIQGFHPLFTIRELFVFCCATGLAASVFFGIETLAHGTAFIKSFIAYQIKLFSTGDSGHGRPFYFHFIVLLFGCFPASFFAAISLFRRTMATEQQRQFSLLMVILFWTVLILFSIVKTKTVLYSSLTYFPITYLAALYLHTLCTASGRPGRALIISLGLFGGLISLVITLFPVLIVNKQWIIPLIRDKFAVACLEHPVPWTGFEFLLGICYLIALAATLALFIRNRPLPATVTLFSSSALCLFMFMYIFAPKIEAYTQGGPIAFYKEHSGKDEYVRALFKSYADLFYGNKRPDDHMDSHSLEWLLRGPIDKPAYFVARITQSKKYDQDTTLDLVRLKSEYGFVFYAREAEKREKEKSILKEDMSP
ncbi:MAG: glycosyltransferase family 39 protein [Chitinispirillaceae bacterium]|nr:glycosyltransferase family 39 protein [Chitinispirillaceae bacterium]